MVKILPLSFMFLFSDDKRLMHVRRISARGGPVKRDEGDYGPEAIVTELSPPFADVIL